MTMAFDDLRSVSGYWLGPPVWFESPRPEPLAIPGLPEQSLTVYRRLLDRGGEAVVSTAGVVLFDFAGLEPDDPTAKELATSPFPDSPRTAAASVVAPRRVELLNAHQLCLLDAIGVLESDEDVWSPDPRPVGVRTLWTGLSVEQVTIPNDELTTYLAFLRDTPPTLRRAFTFRGDTIDRSFTTYEQVLAVPVAPRACHCLLHAADHYHHWRFDQALMLAWAAAEALLAELWARYAEDAAQAAGHTLNSNRRRKLTGREFTSSVVSENLALAGIIDQELYDEIARVRAARNRWAHGLDPVTEQPAASAFFAGQTLVGLLTGCQLNVGIGLAAPNM
jgi:hypothetical protein